MLELALLIVFLGLLFDYTNGFHDAANVVSTVIATRVLAPVSAIVMAGVLNFVGATQVSGVAQTVASGLIRLEETTQWVVLSAVLSAIVWNCLTWYYRIPSSSSYALIGGLLGAAWAYQGLEIILWDGVFYKVLIPMAIAPLLGFGCSFFLMKLLQSHLRNHPASRNKKIFHHLQIGSACLVALTHGLNDAQKSMGLITLGLVASGLLETPEVPYWVIFSCALVMGLGTAFGGLRIVRTMGFSITKIDPMQGFVAEASASSVILAASLLGMPLSSSHMIAGSITGVGSAKGPRAVHWSIPKKIALAWFFTLPGVALFGAGLYTFISLFR